MEHDWRTVRELRRADILLLLEHCRRCDAGRATTTDSETGGRRMITAYPDPLPVHCPGADDSFRWRRRRRTEKQDKQ